MSLVPYTDIVVSELVNLRPYYISFRYYKDSKNILPYWLSGAVV